MRLSKFVKASSAGWLVLAAAFCTLMVVGSQRDSSPSTPQERVEAISRQLACPTCDGESVSESRGAASQAIRQEISRLVAQGTLTDDEIVAVIDDSYAESLRLAPASTGIESLVWVLPVVAGAVAIFGLTVVFGRWRRTSAASDGRIPSGGVARGAALRTVIGLTLAIALAVVAGLAVARNTGDRRPGQGMTGGGVATVTSLLAEARALGMADLDNALGLYAQVLEQEPNNVEALTYFGWLTVLSASQLEDKALVAERLDSGLLLLRQATIVDATYPDAHCFLGISFFRFLADPAAASPELETCLASNPPSEVAVLVEGLAQEVTDALSEGSNPETSAPE